MDNETFSSRLNAATFATKYDDGNHVLVAVHGVVDNDGVVMVTGWRDGGWRFVGSFSKGMEDELDTGFTEDQEQSLIDRAGEHIDFL